MTPAGASMDPADWEDQQVSDLPLTQSASACRGCDWCRHAEVFGAVGTDRDRYRRALERLATDQMLHTYMPELHEIAVEALNA